MKTRGMLLGAISERYDTIVEFTAFEDFISFERKGKNKVKRTQNHKIKVTIEVNMVWGVVNLFIKKECLEIKLMKRYL